MPDYRFTRPKITWGAAFANTLNIGYPLDNARSFDEPRDGSEFVQGASGIEDAWITGTDFVLEADVRWIPQVDVASPLATGWDGVSGFRAFLAWARNKSQFRFYPDAAGGVYVTCYLVEPIKGAPDSEDDGTRKVHLIIRNAASAFDGY